MSRSLGTVLWTAAVAAASAGATAVVLNRRAARLRLEEGVFSQALTPGDAADVPTRHASLVDATVIDVEPIELDDLPADVVEEGSLHAPTPGSLAIAIEEPATVRAPGLVPDHRSRLDEPALAVDHRADQALTGLGVALTAWLIALAVVAGLALVLLR